MTHLSHKERWTAFSLLAVTAFVLILDAAIVNIALPSIGTDLGVTKREDLSWVMNAYALAFGGFLLLGGRLADYLGRRRMFMIGMTIFTLASALGALSPNLFALVSARALQGFGAALVTPAALSLVLTLFNQGTERNKALGLWGAVAGSGAAAGTILGGFLTEWFGWEAVMWVNVPVGIAVLFLAPKLLPEVRDEKSSKSFDILGAILITAGIAIGVYALVDANEAGWKSTQTIGLGILSVALIAGFVLLERVTKDALVPLKIFRIQSVSAANIIALFTSMVMFPMFVFISMYLQEVVGSTPIQAGLQQLPIAITFMLSAGIVAKLVSRFGYKPLLVAGPFIMSIGILWLSRMPADGTWLGNVLTPSIIAAIGGATAFIPMTIAATSGVSHEENGLVSGLLNTTQQVGGALGLAIGFAISTAVVNGYSLTEQFTPKALSDGFGQALQVASFIGIGAAILSAIILYGRRSTAGEVPVTAKPGEVEPSYAATGQ